MKDAHRPPRQRLSARLAHSAQYPISLVIAGEGFGKTAAINDYLDTLSTCTVHVDIDPDAASLVPFLRTFAQALEHAVPGLRTSFAGAIEYALQSAKPHEELALWLGGHLQNQTATIVIENLHNVHDEQAFALLRTVLEQAPSTLRWILASRTADGLPLEEWNGRRLAAPILDEHELRLTEAEAASFAQSRSLALDQLQALYALSGGWPLAFTLGTRSVDWIKPLHDLRPQNTTALYSFLAEQYFTNCSPGVRQLLTGMSVFSSIDRDVVEASNGAAAWKTLQTLAEQGLLLSVRRDGSLRFHDLFRGFLQRRLETAGPRAAQDALARSGETLERCGRVSEALVAYTRAGRTAEILRLCESHGFDLIDRGHVDELRSAIAIADQQQEQSQPAMLSAIRAIDASQTGRHDLAESWFVHALGASASPATHAEIACRYALHLIRHGRPDGVELLEPYMDDQSIPADLQSAIRSTLATAYVLLQRFDEARDMIATARSLMDERSSAALRAKLDHQAAWVALFTGDVDAARRHALAAVDEALGCDLYDVAARAYTVLYNISYDVADNPKASRELLERILDCGLKAGNAEVRLFALLGNLDVAAELGEWPTIARIEVALTSHEFDYSDPMTSEALLPAQALMRAGRGDFAGAYELLFPTGERQFTDDRRAFRFSEIALYAAAAHLRPKASQAIAEVESRLGDLEPATRRTIRTELNYAMALRLVDRTADARTALDHLCTYRYRVSERLTALIDAVLEIFRHWDGFENHADLFHALNRLRDQDFGGLSAVLSALPRGTRRVPSYQ